MKTSILRGTYASAAALALVLSGCSAVSPGADAASGGTILVGGIAGTTGAYGAVGQAVFNGTQMAVDEVNSAGGVLGKKLKFSQFNDAGSATTSAQLFTRLVSAGAVAIIGSPDTGPTTAAMAEKLKIPNIGAVDGGGLTVYPQGPGTAPLEWVFSSSSNTFAWGGAIGSYALANCKGMAVLHDTSPYGLGGLAGIKASYDAAGKKIAFEEGITENWGTGATVGLKAEIQKIQAAGADCVDIWLTPQDQAAFIQESKTLGAKFTFMGNDGTNSDPTFTTLAKDQAEGMISASLTAELVPNARMTAFQSAYQAKFKTAPGIFAEISYDAIYLLVEAIKNGKSTKADDLKAQLNKITNYDGITGSLSFTPQQHTTINSDQLTIVKYSVADKKWAPVS